MVFCNKQKGGENIDIWNVTILILIDGFLQWVKKILVFILGVSHNPYFNRWFSAIYNWWKQVKAHVESQSLF